MANNDLNPTHFAPLVIPFPPARYDLETLSNMRRSAANGDLSPCPKLFGDPSKDYINPLAESSRFGLPVKVSYNKPTLTGQPRAASHKIRLDLHVVLTLLKNGALPREAYQALPDASALLACALNMQYRYPTTTPGDSRMLRKRLENLPVCPEGGNFVNTKNNPGSLGLCTHHEAMEAHARLPPISWEDPESRTVLHHTGIVPLNVSALSDTQPSLWSAGQPIRHLKEAPRYVGACAYVFGKPHYTSKHWYYLMARVARNFSLPVAYKEGRCSTSPLSVKCPEKYIKEGWKLDPFNPHPDCAAVYRGVVALRGCARASDAPYVTCGAVRHRLYPKWLFSLMLNYHPNKRAILEFLVDPSRQRAARAGLREGFLSEPWGEGHLLALAGKIQY